jgi:hypothetical protein
MRRYDHQLDTDPETAWRLYSRPENWPKWAPHMRGASRITGPGGEVRAGARGIAWMPMPVPVRVTEVHRGKRWSWRIGPVEFDHVVEPRPGGGCTVALQCRTLKALEPVVAAAYAPVSALSFRNMDRISADAG